MPISQLRATLFVLLISMTGYTLRGQPTNAPQSYVAGGAQVLNAVKERLSGEASGDRLEIYVDALFNAPIALKVWVSVQSSSSDMCVPLSKGGMRWCQLLRATVIRNGEETSTYQVSMIADSERVEHHPRDRFESGGFSKQLPDRLCANETALSLWEMKRTDEKAWEPGLYRIALSSQVDFASFYGIDGGMWGQPEVFVKKRQNGDDDRHIEDLVQEHYALGTELYGFDRSASKKHFQQAWDLLVEYRRRGFGDTPDVYNITPRWQTSLVAGWLDDPVSEIAYLSEMLSRNAGAKAAGKECKLRYYQFGRERGLLPRNVEDDLGRKVNRLYESFYGKRMNGQPVQPVRPWPKQFEDSSDPTLKLEELLPKNPE